MFYSPEQSGHGRGEGGIADHIPLPQRYVRAGGNAKSNCWLQLTWQYRLLTPNALQAKAPLIGAGYISQDLAASEHIHISWFRKVFSTDALWKSIKIHIAGICQWTFCLYFFLWDLQREAFYLKAYLSGLKCKSVHVMQFQFSGQEKTELKLDWWYNNSKVKRKWGNIRLLFESWCYRLMITSNSPPPMTDNDPKFFSLKYVYDSLHAVFKSSQ